MLGPAKALEREGWSVTYLGVDENGMVSPDAVAEAIMEKTALVSVMAANNEVGTLQPITAIGAICAARGVLFHNDLAQAVAYVDMNVEKDNIHLASLSAHKAYGPKGVGALYYDLAGHVYALHQFTVWRWAGEKYPARNAKRCGHCRHGGRLCGFRGLAAPATQLGSCLCARSLNIYCCRRRRELA